jgi:NitT/TauT family transport system ATP-binding protein
MIRLEDVTRSFETQTGDTVLALERISLGVDRGTFLALLGPSGCGKSTLLKLTSGLMPLTSGSIHINETLISEPFSDTGFVFQQPVLLPWRTVLGNVMLSIEMLGRDPRKYHDEALSLLRLAGLAGFENKFPRELSGGMQQRVSICRALIHQPALLLMDEPFGALDALTREEMSFALLRIWEERRTTILFVTHSIPEAVLLADTVVVMTARPGRIAAVIEIELPRPRTLDMEFDPAFKAHATEIRRLIGAGHAVTA